jgi:hypothetical protein
MGVVVLYLYPSAHAVDGWDALTAENAYWNSIEDHVCATATVLGGGAAKTVDMSAFRDSAGNAPAIPVTATINSVYVGINGTEVESGSRTADVTFELSKGIQTFVCNVGNGQASQTNACLNSVTGLEAACQPLIGDTWKPEDINSEDYTTKLRVASAGNTTRARVDYCYIKVTYTEAVVAAKKPLMDGLIFVD